MLVEVGLAMGYEKFIMGVDQAGMMAVFAKGVDMSANGQALDAIAEVGPGLISSVVHIHRRISKQHFISLTSRIIVALSNGSKMVQPLRKIVQSKSIRLC